MGLMFETELFKSSQSFHATDIPFTIEPMFGTIPVGEEASFTVRFSPIEIQDFNANLCMRHEVFIYLHLLQQEKYIFYIYCCCYLST